MLQSNFFRFVESRNRGKNHICLIAKKKPRKFDDDEKTKMKILTFCYDDFMMHELKRVNLELEFEVKSNLKVEDDSVWFVSDNGAIYQLKYSWIRMVEKKEKKERKVSEEVSLKDDKKNVSSRGFSSDDDSFGGDGQYISEDEF